MNIGINLISEPLQKAGTGRYACGLLSGLNEQKDNNNYYVFVNKDNKANFYVDDSRFKFICLGFNAKSAFVRRLYEQVVLPFVLPKYKIELLHSVNNIVPVLYLNKSSVMVHDIATWESKNRFEPKKRLFLMFFNIFSWITLRFCKKILTVSEFSKNQITDSFKSMQGTITVVHNGVEKIFKPNITVSEVNRVKSKYQIDDKYIFSWASIERTKNLERLFEAFAQWDLKSLQLVISGKKSNYWQEIIEKIHELGLEEKVIMTGYVSDEDLVSLIHGSEFVIFPSLYEGAGLPAIEAMACGKAVATSNIPAVKEYCGNVALYFDPYDVSDMSEAMRSLLVDTQLRKDFVKKGLLKSREYDWKQHAEKTKIVWQSSTLK